VEVRFKTRKLKKHYEKSTEAEKTYGRELARKYIQRVNIIKQVRDINELCDLPGLRCHPLKGKRRGQWAVKLTGFYRLIFTLQGKIPVIAQIEEVSKHYDE